VDWQLISLSIRDHEGGRTKYNWSFTLRNVIKRFGQGTEYEEVKVKLRPLYKELSKAIDENDREIPGVISEDRFIQIVYIVRDLLDEYYFRRRFDK
jgi:hypothetical protein